MDNSYTREDLQNKSCKELRTISSRLGLPIGGSKLQLINRLVNQKTQSNLVLSELNTWLKTTE